MPNPLPLNSLPLLIILIFSLFPFPYPTQAKPPHIIKFKSPSLYPEGLSYDPISHHFIVGSLNQGSFHSISDAGVIETLISDILPPKSIILGLSVDHRHRRLLAAVNTPSPQLAAFSLHRSSLQLHFLSPLPDSPNDVANDVTVDPYGNAYVTNSGNNLIWKVDMNGTSSIFSKSPLFTHYPVDPSPYSYCGLNGVVYVTGKGYLLAVQSNTGKMFKVDLDDGTAKTVGLPEDLPVADGIAVRDDGVVVVVSMNCAWLLKSDDSWGRAAVIDKIALDREGFPTSVTVGGEGRVYVIYGHVEEGMKGNSEREWFRIEEIRSEKESDGDTVWPFVLLGLGLAYFLFWRFQMKQLVDNLDRKKV